MIRPTGIKQHAGAQVELRVDQEVEIRLFQLQLARFFETFDERVFELQLSDEAEAIGEAVIEQQHEPVEVENAVIADGLVEVEVHVARDGPGARFELLRLSG